jgi:hypothetical protein
MSDSVGQIALDLGVNYNGFNKQLSGIAGNATNMVGGAFKKLGGIIAGAFAIKGLIDFGKESIELASNLSEVQNVVDVTFGSMASDINSWSKTALQGFGLSELSAKKYSSTMGAMMKSSGLAGIQMEGMSKKLTELAGDMASFYNLSTDMAFEKIRSGISGETEPLKQLGVNMSVANMEAFALSQGIKKSYDSMTQAEQTLLRYNYLLSVTGDAQGDFARTSGSWANQVRLLGEQWKVFQGTMGSAFISLLTPVLQMLNSLIAKLQIAAEYFKAFVELITGTESTAQATTGAVTDLGSSVANTGNAVKKANKTVKGSLAGFDQLNTISQNASNALDSMADASGAASDFSMPSTGTTPELNISSNISKVLAEIKEAFAPAQAALERFKKALEPLKNFVAQGLKDFFNGVLVPLAKWTISEVLPNFLDTLTILVQGLTPILEGFNKVFKVFWTEYLQPLAQYAREKFIGFLKSMNGGLTQLKDMISQTTIFEDFAVIVGKIAPVLRELVRGLMDLGGFVLKFAWLDGINAATLALKDLEDVIGFVAAVLTGDFSDAWEHFRGYMIDNKIDFAKSALDTLKDKFGDLKSIIGGWVTNWGEQIKKFVDTWKTGIANWWSNNVLPWFTKEKWNKILFQIGESLGLALASFVTMWTQKIPNWWTNNVAPWFTREKWVNLFSSIKDGIVTALTNFISAWKTNIANWWTNSVLPWFTKQKWLDLGNNIKNGIVNGFKSALGGVIGVINSIMGAFQGLVNGVIKGVNKIIGGYNSVADKVPALPSMGLLKEWSAPKISVPAFANGALVSAPTLAMVGDNRNAQSDPEVISPLSKLQGMINGSNTEVVELLKALIALIKNLDTPIIMKLGETEVGRATIKAINNVQRAAGETLLIV